MNNKLELVFNDDIEAAPKNVDLLVLVPSYGKPIMARKTTNGTWINVNYPTIKLLLLHEDDVPVWWAYWTGGVDEDGNFMRLVLDVDSEESQTS